MSTSIGTATHTAEMIEQMPAYRIDVYQPGVPRIALNEGDLLTGDPMAPGFSMPIAALFD